MKLHFSIIIGLMLASAAKPQEAADSLLNNRNGLLEDYTSFKSRMKERTWLNVVDMNLRAEKIIETDNHLIKNLLQRNYESEREFNLQLESLSDSLQVLQNENKALGNQSAGLEQIKIILWASLALSLAIMTLFLVLFIVNYQKHGRYRRIAEKADAINHGLQKEIILLQDNIAAKAEVIRNNDARLKAEMDAMHSDLEKSRETADRMQTESYGLLKKSELLQDKIREMEENTRQEKLIREEMERRINVLIDQLRQKLV
ncbi:MAG: hypothetical protein JXA03_06880 [Bacteroidales bacterium]|nr:hypothetical protein [Bacteroidales bacterium]